MRMPSVRHRAGYILTTILLPYSLNRVLPAFRRRVRSKLESSLARSSKAKPSTTRTIQQYILNNIDTLTSPSPIYAVSLATFYFSGAYYHLSKRIWGLRYIFTHNLTPSDQRVGYEVLGLLLVCQIAVQGCTSTRPGPHPPTYPRPRPHLRIPVQPWAAPQSSTVG